MDRHAEGATPEPGQARHGWSFGIGTALGIPIRVHFTFLLLLLWFGLGAQSEGGSFLVEVVFLVLAFGCVVLHELGHAAVARRHGVRTQEIVLYPIGGVSRLEKIPEGKAEIFIALAGPAVSLAIAAALLLLSVALRIPWPERPETLMTGGGIVPRLAQINFLIAFFNLIPAFPMDGGRVLRAALSLKLPADRATGLAATVGQGIAILFGLAGLFAIPGIIPSNPLLVIIALFLFLGAGQEAAFFRQRALVLGHVARETMMTRFDVLAPQDSLARAAELLLAGSQQDFPVVDAWGRVVGVLTRAALLQGFAGGKTGAAVLEVMDRNVVSVAPDTDLESILGRVRSSPAAPVLVLGGGRLVGMITLEDLAEFVALARHLPSPARSGGGSQA